MLLRLVLAACWRFSTCRPTNKEEDACLSRRGVERRLSSLSSLLSLSCTLLQNRLLFQTICPGSLWARDNRWFLSRVRWLAGPAGDRGLLSRLVSPTGTKLLSPLIPFSLPARAIQLTCSWFGRREFLLVSSPHLWRSLIPPSIHRR